jgi:hypothetical protein
LQRQNWQTARIAFVAKRIEAFPLLPNIRLGHWLPWLAALKAKRRQNIF